MQIKLNHFKTLALVMSMGITASCSLSALTAETEDNIDNVKELADKTIEASAIPDSPLPIDTVRTKQEIWLGNSSSKIAEGEPLPARFETETAITIIGNTEMTLMEIAKKLSSLTGLLVRIDDLLLDNSGKSSSGAETSTTLAYSGRLSGLLDQICSRFGIWWRYKGGVVTFYEMETRSFTIYALPTSSSISSSVSNSGGGESETGSSTADISNDITLEAWAQIEETIKNILPASAKMTISSTNGMITVTAPPDTLLKVSKYVRDINEKLSRQVTITVRVLQVSLNKSNNYGLNLHAAFKNLGNTVADLNFLGPGSVWTPGVGLTAPEGGGALSMILTGEKYDLDTIIQALSSQGETTVITTATVTTMNNKVAPVQVAKNQEYVSSVETTIDNGTTSTSVETDTLNTGFNMDVLPRILDHGRLLLMFSMTLNSLLEMLDYDYPTSGGGTASIALPYTETRGFNQEVIMKSGSTLIVTGFEQADDELNKEGTGSADFVWLGGKRTSETKRTVLVVLLSPVVMVSPLSPETRVNDL